MRLPLLLGLMGISAGAIFGSTVANSFDAISTTTDFPATLGYVFIPQYDILVTGLGYYDYGADGLEVAHNVGIFTAPDAPTLGTLIGSVTVGAGTGAALDGGFRYVTLATPIALQAETPYIIAGTTGPLGGDYWGYGSYRPGGPDPILNYSSPTSLIDIPVERAFYSYTANPSTLVYPTHQSSGTVYDIYAGPNMQFLVAAPEPGTLLLLLTGVLGLGVYRRKAAR